MKLELKENNISKLNDDNQKNIKKENFISMEVFIFI